MPRNETASPARIRTDSGPSYRGSLSVLAFLVTCLTALLLIMLETSSLSPLVHTLWSAPSSLSAEDIQRLLLIIAVSLGAGILAVFAARGLIQLVRIQTYRRHLHGYAKQWLRTYAPLSICGTAPDISKVDPTLTDGTRTRVRLQDLIRARTPILLTGASCSGKTVTLHALVYELTRKRALPRLWVGRAPLPVLLAFGGSLVEGDERDDILAQVQESLHQFGTRGLAAQVHVLAKRGRIALLCDGLDGTSAGYSFRLRRQLEDMAATGRHIAIVVAALAETSGDPASENVPSPGWQSVTLEPLKDGQIQAVLRISRAETSTEARSFHAPVPDVLTPSLRSPATVGRLLRVSTMLTEWPASDASLARLYAENALANPEPGSIVDAGRMLMLIGAIAAGLRVVGQHVIPTAPNGSLGRSLAEWIERVAPPTAVESAGDELLLLRPEEIEIACQLARRRGILVQDAGKHMLRFADRSLEAVFAERWLDATDTGLGRLRPELVQSQWTQPVLLWAGADDQPGDIAGRLLRLLDAPGTPLLDTFASTEQFYAAVLALALGAACVSLAPLVERESGAGAAVSHHVYTLVEDQLRDLLDRLFRCLNSAEQETALRDALMAVVNEGGPETLSCLRYLAMNHRIPRLVRAQLVVVLGLTRLEEAASVVVAQLDDPDVLMRQAVERALALAGIAALPALRASLSSSSERVRLRAAEALAQIGDTAVDTVISGLDARQSTQRAAAAQTLGSLKATRGEGMLTERLNRDTAEEVRSASALALGQIGSEQAALALEQSVVGESSTDVRAAIAQALGATRQPLALRVLLNLLTDTEPRVRAAAAAALGVLGDERAVPALREHRDDRDLWTQNAVMQSLRRLGG